MLLVQFLVLAKGAALLVVNDGESPWLESFFANVQPVVNIMVPLHSSVQNQKLSLGHHQERDGGVTDPFLIVSRSLRQMNTVHSNCII